MFEDDRKEYIKNSIRNNDFCFKEEDLPEPSRPVVRKEIQEDRVFVESGYG